MTWVKICGTTNLEDALTAVEAGADAVGFVFYEKSPRKIDPQAAKEISDQLPDDMEKVGVFVDADSDSIRRTVLQAGLTAVQLHGQTSRDSVWQDARPALESVGVSKVIPMIPGNALQNGGIFMSDDALRRAFALLIDAELNGASGGTGTTFDWDATRGMVQSISLHLPVIIAGGLTPATVGKAMNVFQPFGVDVASGVESSPGKKDPDKVRAFVRAVRDLDRKTS